MAAKKKEPEVPVEVEAAPEPEAVEIAVDVPPPVPEPREQLAAIDLYDDDLADIAARARDCAALVAQHVNPTNVFAEKYEALALACEAVTALCAERGHRGIP